MNTFFRSPKGYSNEKERENNERKISYEKSKHHIHEQR